MFTQSASVMSRLGLNTAQIGYIRGTRANRPTAGGSGAIWLGTTDMHDITGMHDRHSGVRFGEGRNSSARELAIIELTSDHIHT